MPNVKVKKPLEQFKWEGSKADKVKDKKMGYKEGSKKDKVSDKKASKKKKSGKNMLVNAMKRLSK
ncbi:MAG: hypothetical protein WCO06_01485 [Candidatus Roizmanbacteria bacterium]